MQASPEKPSISHINQNDFTQLVSFLLAGEKFAIRIQKTREIILYKDVTKVPKMPDYIEGIINLRGEILPVIDLRKRLGLQPSQKLDQERIVVVMVEGKKLGLIVDAVSRVMKIPTNSIVPPPEAISGSTGEYLSGVCNMDGKMILLLDIDLVLKSTDIDSVQVSETSTERMLDNH